MTIFKRFINILLKTLLGIFVFYLVFCWIIIPLVLPWVIRSQGTKVLKHSVHVRGVGFNPFLWTLSVEGLQIANEHKEKLIGFDRLSVDVSFLRLLKKVYYLESVRLDGLFVHAVLLSSGQINLMALVPPSTPTASSASKPGDQSMPLIVIEDISLRKARIQFDDYTITPTFKTVLSDMDVSLKGFSTQPEAITQLKFKAKLDDKGFMESQAQVSPLSKPLALDLTFALNNYALSVLSPYTGKYTARNLKDGKLDIKVTYRISDNRLTASHKFLIQHFEFGDKVDSKDALHVPFGLAIALLEDPQGRINIGLPAKGDMSDPKFEYTQMIWQVVRNFFVKLVTKPFAILASVIGSENGTEELGYVRFAPGHQELLSEDNEKLGLLVKGLKERPKVLLEINGSYDPIIDWKAIKTETFQNDYKILKGESTKKEDWVYQSLYQRRFGVLELWKLTRAFKTKEGGYQSQKMNEEIKRRLIEDAPPDKVALDYLAQSRAKTVYDGIIQAGLDPNHVHIGNPHETQGSMGFIPLEFTLTVFEESGRH